MSQAPALTWAMYNGTQVSAQWSSPTSGTPQSYTLQVLPSGGSGATYTQGNIPMNTGTVAITAPLSGQYMVQVGAVYSGSSTPVWSQGFLLLTTQPVITSASYNGTSVKATWNPIPNAQPAISSWDITVWVPTGGGVLYTTTINDPNATSGTLAIPTPLVSLGSNSLYAVTVKANTSYNAQTYSNPATLNVELPVITKAIYDGANLQGFWSGPFNPDVPIAGFRFSLLDEEGNEVFGNSQANGAASSDILTLPVPIPTSGKYYVIVAAYTAANVSAVSPSVLINTILPALEETTLENVSGNLTVEVIWTPLVYAAVPVGSVQLIVQSPSMGTPYTTAISDPYASSGTVNVNAGWTASLAYYVQVSAISTDGVVEARSTPAQLITVVPAFTLSGFNGDSFNFSWNASTSSFLPTSYKIEIRDNNEVKWYTESFPGVSAVSGQIELLAPLNTALVYSAYLYAENDTVRAKSAAVQLLQDAPLVIDVIYDHNQVNARWYFAPPVTPAVTSITVAVTSAVNGTGFSATGLSASTSNYILPVTPVAPATTLDPSLEWQLEVTALVGTTVVAAYPPVPLVTSLPVLNSIVYDPTAQLLYYSWLPAPDDLQQVAGYMLSLYSTQGGQPYSTYINSAFSGEGSISLASGLPSDTLTWTAMVQSRATGGVSKGNSNGLTLNMGSTTMASAAYNNGILQLSATAVGGSPTYRFQLLEGTAVVGTWDSAAASLSVPVTLDPEGSYSVLVNYGLAGAWGPVSAAISLLTTVPVIATTAYNSGTTTVTATWPEVSGATYTLQLWQDETLVATVPSTNMTTASGIVTASFVQSLAASSDYYLLLAVTVANATGPFSAPAPVLSAAATINAAAYDGTALNLEWEVIPSPVITGYLVTIYSTIGSVTTALPVTSANYSRSNSLSFTIAAPVAGTTYSAGVQGIVNNVATGPSSATTAMLTDTPVISSASYNDGSLQLNWGAVAGISVFDVLLYENGELLATLASDTNSLVTSIELAPAGTYTAKVNTVNGVSSGPTSSAISLLTTVPVISTTTYTSSSTTVTATWPEVSGATYTLQLWQDETLVATVPSTNMTTAGGIVTASFVQTLAASSDYYLLLAVTVANATGPFSAPAPVLSAAATINAAAYDGTALNLEWEAIPSPAVTGYLVTIYSTIGSVTMALPVTSANYSRSNNLSFTIAAPAAGTTYSAGVQGLVNNVATGPSSATAAMLTDVPVISSASYNDGTLQLNWGAVAGISVYDVLLYENGELLATLASDTNSLVTSIELAPAGTYTAKVNTVSGVSSGPVSSAVTLITLTPVITNISYNTAQTLSVAWTFAGTATAYTLLLYNEDMGITISPTYSGNTATVDNLALDPNKVYTVTVNAVNGSVTGPATVPEPLISATPVIEESYYDGGVLTVKWGAIPQEVVTGYVISINSTNYNVATNSLVLPVAFTPGTSYSMSVIASGNKAIGPESSTVNPYVVDPAFYFSAYVQNVAPYLYPSATQPPATAAFTLYLPQLFNTPPTTLPSGLTDPSTLVPPLPNSPFVMSTTGNALLPYKITVALTSDAFIFSANQATIRPQLQADYLAFVTQLETVAGGLLPGAIPFIQQIVARSFPLTYDETLYYGYGYNPGSRYVNLQSGMRLTLSFEEYQFTSTSQSTLQNGYVGSGSSSYILGSYLSNNTPGSQVQDVGFTNFLSRIINSVESNTGGGGGVLDYYVNNFRQPWMRLIYPATFPSADKTGTSSLNQNVILLAAPTYTALDSATTTLINGGSVPAGVYATFLRGRVVLVPEIQVHVNGMYMWLPLGITIRQLADQFGGISLRPQAAQSTWKESGLELSRSIENVITDLSQVSTTYPVGEMMAVNIGYSAITAYSNGSDNYDLPLMQGDVIYF